ncbi:AraC family transcriptional regulator [Clostridium pasteurianum]|uniref:helix-turn-helix domain-containing protein n=1 Tax=Clostridium pasteurianum TaxID=1501 RepID=UPI002260C76D|nr:AraC family transcriptional regulator [Clostridium pasteurianum]UZW12835.1 AraC family transcriptional regulator [Clostridium pasteurianum]
MNLDIVEKVVEYIEENYHSHISEEIIETITGKSSGYVRNEFKKVVNIPIDEYRIRRQLSLIIQEMKNINKKLNNSNLLPWNTQNSFSKVFKSNFGEPPMQFIKHYNEHKLQYKFNVKKFKVSYNSDIRIIEGLIRKLGNKTNALIYILSLKPYILNPIDNLFAISGVNIKDILIKTRYAQGIKKNFFAGKVPREFYNNHSKLLDKYYDMKKGISFNQFHNEDTVFHKQYILVKKSIIHRILEYTKLDSIINDKTDPNNLVTLWYEDMRVEESKDGMIAMPNELIESGIGMMKWTILSELVFQEQGFVKYTTMEELRVSIKYDYCKPIDVFKEYCEKCNYRNYCDDDSDCLYIEELSEKEKKEFYDKPDHEVLTMERLCEEIKELFIVGLICFNYYE